MREWNQQRRIAEKKNQSVGRKPGPNQGSDPQTLQQSHRKKLQNQSYPGNRKWIISFGKFLLFLNENRFGIKRKFVSNPELRVFFFEMKEFLKIDKI